MKNICIVLFAACLLMLCPSKARAVSVPSLPSTVDQSRQSNEKTAIDFFKKMVKAAREEDVEHFTFILSDFYKFFNTLSDEETERLEELIFEHQPRKDVECWENFVRTHGDEINYYIKKYNFTHIHR